MDYKERMKRRRQAARGESHSDAVSFALASQAVIVVAILLCALAASIVNNDGYKNFKSRYSMIISSAEETEKTQRFLTAGESALGGAKNFVSGFLSEMFGAGSGDTHGKAYIPDPEAEDEPVDEIPEIPEITPQTSNREILRQTIERVTESYHSREYPIKDSASEEISSGEENLYLNEYTGGEIFPAEIIANAGLKPASLGAYVSPLYLNPAMIPPVAGMITSGFAKRKHPITGKEHFHTAIDIGANAGDGIAAAMDGIVKSVGESGDYGLYLILEHPGGLETAYAHCSEIIAREGMVIRQGERIALVGDTGLTTGPHLHFSVQLNGKDEDPVKYLGDYISAVK